MTAPRGTPEAVWQAWPGLARLPSLGVADGLPAADARLVVVAPHPDDELLACGGLLALHAGAGGAALLVAVTDGEASHPASPTWNASRLASARSAESAAGLACLLPAVPPPALRRLGLPDGDVRAHVDRLAVALVGLLNPADCVITTWRLDGHPDHEATGDAVARAAATVGCRLLEAPVWMWHWALPADTRVPWHRLRAQPLPGSVQQLKRQAIAAHATQLAPRDGLAAADGPVLDADILARLQRAHEYFFVGG